MASIASNAPQKKRRISRSQLKADVWGWLFVSPLIIGTAVFVFIPLGLTIYASFTNWTGVTDIGLAKIRGIANYVKVFSDADVYKTLVNTVFYMLGIPIGLVLSLFLAVCMNRKIKFRNGFRVVYYIPVVASVVSVSLLFQKMFDPNGIINGLLKLFGGKPVFWLTAPMNKVTLLIMMIWKGLGGTILLFIAGLQGVNRAYYEAAKLDGAGEFKIFYKITLPQLMPVVFFVVVTSVIGGAQVFSEPMIMFGSQDMTSMTIVMYIRNKSLGSTAYQAGYATAISVVLGVAIFIVTAVQFAVNRRRDV